jgi:hypothetical protein
MWIQVRFHQAHNSSEESQIHGDSGKKILRNKRELPIEHSDAGSRTPDSEVGFKQRLAGKLDVFPTPHPNPCGVHVFANYSILAGSVADADKKFRRKQESSRTPYCKLYLVGHQ